MSLNLLGAVLLVTGFAAAFLLERRRAAAPEAGWYPDPSTRDPALRYWDGRAWTGQTQPGGIPAARGRRFRGRFRGGWIWLLLLALAVLAAGSAAYSAGHEAGHRVGVMALTSLLAMALVCCAFYRFVARQIALDDVIGLPEVLAATVAGAGATLLIALNLNDAIIKAGGTGTAVKFVGFVEEGTKLLVPLLLYALGRYRDPRAGIALGLAGGFGFAIAETTIYAYNSAAASGPDFCGGTAPEPTTSSVVLAQVTRIFTVSPFHWLWTGIAAAIAWRAWHLYGRKGTLRALGGILLVMVIHSINDTSATLGCGNPGVQLLLQLFRWGLLIGMYLLFKAKARKSTPPQLIGAVSRGWTPRHLP